MRATILLAVAACGGGSHPGNPDAPLTPDGPPAPAATCSMVTQWGITWTFDAEYPCGQFINGDTWVTPSSPGGHVRIMSITPAVADGRNGWEVNPTDIVMQGFDRIAPDFDGTLVPALPYDAAPDTSIIQAVSNATGCDGGAGGKTCLTTAAVLTVLGAVPADQGATVFRPPYFGTAKPLISSKDIDWTKLPSFPTTSAIDGVSLSLADALATITRVQLAYKPDWIGDQIHPSDNFQLDDPYGPEVSNQNVNAVLRAMLDVPGDAADDREKVLVALVQYGIDNHGVLIAGGNWITNGGHDMGMRLPIVLASYFLGDATMASDLAGAPAHAFAETGMTYVSPHTGAALWGQPLFSGEQDYWDDITQQAGRTYLDPYGYIDGGPTPGTWYQDCCTSQAMKGSTLVVRLVPGLADLWANDASLQYAERWVATGAAGAPDPCAPLSQGGGPDPQHPGQCILDPDLTAGSTFTTFSCQAGKQCGRFPAAQATGADGGGHRSGFVDAFWTAYH